MSHSYRTLFAAPGALGFVLAGLLARLPLPMTGIGIITMLSQLRGSYALAGAVSASFVLACALLSPQVSRLVDRHGQRRVLPWAAGLGAIGMGVLLLSAWYQWADALLFAGALLAGCMPSISAMMRARWTQLYRGQPQLQTAYALEAVLDEVSFIAGPPLSVGLAVGWWAPAGVMAAALLLVLGVAALVAQRRTEPQVQAPDGAAQGGSPVLARRPVQLLALLMVAMGVIVGTVDIASVAFAVQQGQPAAASGVLSAYALASCLAGLGFGALRLAWPLHRLLLWGGLATGAAAVPLLWVDHLLALVAAVSVAGLFFAPTLIVVMSLVERLVPERQLTEGMTWLLAGLNVGVALGAAAAGQVVDAQGAQAGFRVALLAGLAVALLACACYRQGQRTGPLLAAAAQ